VFRLIGFLVIVGVVYLGWGSLQALWDGEISGRDATKEVVQKISDSLDKEGGAGPVKNNEQTRRSDEPQERQSSPVSAEDMVNEMLKRK
jgi:hypothetical protein